MFKIPYSQQKDVRQQNTSALLRDLWRHAPLSKAMLAHRNGLTKSTVSAICNDLARLDLIREVGRAPAGLGRPGSLLELNPMARCAIGVEISTNFSAVVLTDLCGLPLWQRSTLTIVGSSQETILSQAEELIRQAIEQARESALPLLGVGVAVPGIVNPGPQSQVRAPALGWKEVPLKEIWEARFAVPVIVENRARAAAMAEALHGSAQNASSFVYVTVGTDVGSSIEAAAVTDGYPHRGASGMAVDAGHMILDPHGPLCACGQRGCWQAMVDVKREVELALPRLAAGEPSILQGLVAGGGSQSGDGVENLPPLEHRAIHQAALEGDVLALDVFRTVQMNHALGITNLVRLFDPELVVIGWSSAALPEPYQTRMVALDAALGVPEAVRQHLARRGAAPPAIVYAAHGPEACMLGAAALLVDEFLRTPPTIEARTG